MAFARHASAVNETHGILRAVIKNQGICTARFRDIGHYSTRVHFNSDNNSALSSLVDLDRILLTYAAKKRSRELVGVSRNCIAWPNHLPVFAMCIYLCLVVCDNRESSSLYEVSARTLDVVLGVDGMRDKTSLMSRNTQHPK